MADPASTYRAAFAGRFQGILTWPEFDSLWGRLKTSPRGWYVFDTDLTPPDAVAAPESFLSALAGAANMLAPARSRSWCGAVYVDDPAAPAFVKVFDPFGMAACGGGAVASLPRHVFSRLPPASLHPATPTRQRRRGLLGRLGGRG